MKPEMPQTPTDRTARKLVDMCREGKHHEAMQELYADNARHVEAMEMPGSPYKRVTEGKPALLQMSEHWCNNTTVHSASCSDPMVNGDQFICQMNMDCTSKEGPMAGQRMQMSEFCQYTTNKDGKITEAKFFYGCGA